MIRPLMWLVRGVLVGAAAIVVLHSFGVFSPPMTETARPGYSTIADSSAPIGPSDLAVMSFLEPYRSAAVLHDPEGIKAALLEASTNSPGRTRDIRIEALLSRLADFSIADALSFARAPGIDERFLLPLIASLAEENLETALIEAHSLSSPFLVRRAALAIADVLVADASEVDRVLEILPAADRISFRIELLESLAVTNPSGAIDAALTLEGFAARRRAIEAIAAVTVTCDPVASLALLNRISDGNLDHAFRFSAALALAEHDPDSAIEYLKDLGSTIVMSFDAQAILEKIADRIPARLLSAAGEFPQSVQDSVKRIALRATGEQKPAEALSVLASSSDPNERGALLAGLSVVYARNDPNTALERILALDPASRVATVSVLSEIAQIDFDRAVAIALENPIINNYTPLAALPINAHLDRAREIADSLVAAGASHESVLATFISDWTMDEPDRALEWALSNRETLNVGVFREIATYTARRRAANAAAVYSRLPSDVGDVWLAAIMGEFAAQDPAAAARLALSLPEGSSRDQAIAPLIQSPLSRGGSIDVTVLDALSSPAVRDEVIRDAFNYMRPAILYELEDLVPHIADSSLRTQFEEALESMR